MSKKMLIDAGHPEETRVALISNRKVEDFDFESASRKPLRGNIYLARITRVEPSLQAAFVEYGGNRHGFLAFSEIHPDYYQIPVSDREKLREAEELEAQLAEEMNRAEDEAEEAESDDGDEDTVELAPEDNGDTVDDSNEEDVVEEVEAETLEADSDEDETSATDADEDTADADENGAADDVSLEAADDDAHDDDVDDEGAARDRAALLAAAEDETLAEDLDEDDEEADTKDTKRELSLEEKYQRARRERIKILRNYKIQEVIKRRQILLVQVVKEERGNKGAALTTYLSLAGRYCVLMPNTSRGGGISRKIANGSDRRRLRKAMNALEIPSGIGLIIRTAGAKRTKAEIKRDYDYLMRLWQNIRDLTLKSIAPCLIYEEASLIKRAIRDLYDKDTDMVLVEGEAGYREAKDFMKMLMPSHAKNVQPYKEKVPLFVKERVEQQLDEMYQPVVKLKSGGYLVIQQTEALISIDVNSGRATKERNIEATALKTNVEAAVEVARQCKLRDLAGLLVVDFIDMEENRNNRTVERKLKDAMKTDRARIQIGRISTFGLLEMSRQRRRSGIVDGTTSLCPTCHGAGHVRSSEMAALRILRAIEEEAIQGRAGTIAVSTSTEVALYILNQKRDWLNRIEETYALNVEVNADPEKVGDTFDIDKRGTPKDNGRAQAVVTADLADISEAEEAAVEASDDEAQPKKKRRRRRKRKADSEAAGEEARQDNDTEEDDESAEASGEGSEDGEKPAKRRRRRGRRGGRRNRRNNEEASGDQEAVEAQGADTASEEHQQEPTVPADEVEAEAEDGEKADAEKTPKKRKRRRKKKEEAANEAVAEDSEVEIVDAQSGKTAEIPANANANGETETAPAEPESSTPAPAPKKATTPPPDTQSDGPKRGGWWQRALGRDQ